MAFRPSHYFFHWAILWIAFLCWLIPSASLAKSAGDIIAPVMTLGSDKSELQQQCPNISQEHALPDFNKDASTWICYVAFDNAYLTGAVAFGTLTNWVKKNQSAIDALAEAIAKWNEAERKVLKNSWKKLDKRNSTTLLNLLQQLAIARYVKDSSSMNGFLWDADQWEFANQQSIDTTSHKLALVKWRVMALEDAIGSLPKQRGSTFRGKIMRSQTIEQLLGHFHAGALVWEPAFVSTSKNRKIALGYTEIAKPVNILFEIKQSTSGRDLGIRQEEITFPPNTVFKVVGKPTVVKNHKESYEGNGFVQNGCQSQKECEGTWASLVIVTLTEDRTGRAKLEATQNEVEAVCGQDQFLEQCGRHELLAPVTGKKKKVVRKLAGTTVADCDHEGHKYSCSSRTTEKKCMACVLCRKSDGKVQTKSATLTTNSCTTRGLSPDGFYFSAGR